MKYKKIVGIFHKHDLDRCRDCLQNLGIKSMTFAYVKGRGESDKEWMYENLQENVELILYVPEVDANNIVQTILDHKRKENISHGIVTIEPVDELYKLER